MAFTPLKLKQSALEEIVWKSIRFNLADYSVLFTQYLSSGSQVNGYQDLFCNVYKVNPPNVEAYLSPRQKPFLVAAKNDDVLDVALEIPYSAQAGSSFSLTEESSRYVSKVAKRYNVKAFAHTHYADERKDGLPSRDAGNLRILRDLSEKLGRELQGVIVGETSHYAFHIWADHYPLNPARMELINDEQLVVPKPEPLCLRSLTNEAYQRWMINFNWARQFNMTPPEFVMAYGSNGRIDVEIV